MPVLLGMWKGTFESSFSKRYLFVFFGLQMAKVGVALSEGRTGAPVAEPMDVVSNGDAKAAASSKEDGNSVRPAAFKFIVGQGHTEFQSNRQQVRPAT